jgi:hypothetical protein
MGLDLDQGLDLDLDQGLDLDLDQGLDLDLDHIIQSLCAVKLIDLLVGLILKV